jgi:hypothetical protein
MNNTIKDEKLQLKKLSYWDGEDTVVPLSAVNTVMDYISAVLGTTLTRKELKELLIQKTELQKKIDSLIEEYITETQGDNLLFITDHAIVRYMERVKGYNFKSDNDKDKIKELSRSPESIRKEMLSYDDQLRIIRQKGERYNKGNVVYITKNLAVITVMIKGD